MTPAALTETRERLIDTAETLFGLRGIEGVSLREITRQAEANVASVNYHFGSREGLIEAVFERRMRPLNEERLRLLSLAEEAAGSGAPTLESILRAFVAPTVRVFRDFPEFMNFAGRLEQKPEEFVRYFRTRGKFPELILRVRGALVKALPDVPVSDLWWGVLFLLGAMIHTWSKGREMERISGGEAKYESDAEMVDRLVSFATAGIRAMARGGKS